MKRAIRYRKSRLGLLICTVMLVCFVHGLVACSDHNSDGYDGDEDRDLDSDLDIEEEEEIRARPVNPAGASFPKTMWRDEVQTGHSFTWGFFPRDHLPNPQEYAMFFPFVWDNDQRRVLGRELI